MQVAMDMLHLHFPLFQSALGQKVEAKPLGWSRRERCQDRAAMCGREVAGLPGKLEWPVGWRGERASALLAKFVLSASFATG